MAVNPQSQTRQKPTQEVLPWYRRRKPLWGYPVAAVIGALAFVTMFGWLLAAIDDAGGLQLLIGALLGLVIYAILF